MNIPDYIESFVAYRTWQWGTTGLLSLNGERWPAGKKLVAHTELCGHPNAFLTNSTKRFVQQITGANIVENETPVHEAPAEGCNCGIYAAKNLKHLERIHYVGPMHDYGVHGEVYLWGRIWDHELGYRAQFAYPKTLTLTFNVMPWSIREIQRRLETLTQYGVNMYLQTVWGQREFLWSKETGFNSRAFESEQFTKMIAERTRWYTFKEREWRMQPGATLVVLGLGIGIIQRVDETKSEVYVSMFNRQTHKIPAMCITFDQQNYRWESTSAGTISSRARAL